MGELIIPRFGGRTVMTVHRLREEGVAWSDLGHEIVILDLRSSRYFSASGPAAVLVATLVDGASVDLLVERLLAAYDTDGETARADIDDFLAELDRRDLLDRAHD